MKSCQQIRLSQSKCAIIVSPEKNKMPSVLMCPRYESRKEGGNQCHRKQKLVKNNKAQCCPGPVPEIHCSHHWVIETLRNWELSLCCPRGDAWMGRENQSWYPKSDISENRLPVSFIYVFSIISGEYIYHGEYIYNGEFCPLNKAKFSNLKRIFNNSDIHLKERHRRKMRKHWFKSILPRRGSGGSSENRQNENKSQKMGIKGSN